MTTPWAQRYALRTHNMGSSAIRELLKLTQQPDLISFAGGLPAPELFPIEEMKAACDVVLSEAGPQAPAIQHHRRLRAAARHAGAAHGALRHQGRTATTSSSRPARSRRWT